LALAELAPSAGHHTDILSATAVNIGRTASGIFAAVAGPDPESTAIVEGPLERVLWGVGDAPIADPSWMEQRTGGAQDSEYRAMEAGGQLSRPA